MSVVKAIGIVIALVILFFILTRWAAYIRGRQEELLREIEDGKEKVEQIQKMIDEAEKDEVTGA